MIFAELLARITALAERGTQLHELRDIAAATAQTETERNLLAGLGAALDQADAIATDLGAIIRADLDHAITAAAGHTARRFESAAGTDDGGTGPATHQGGTGGA